MDVLEAGERGREGAEGARYARCGRIPRTSPTASRRRYGASKKTNVRPFRAYLLKEHLRQIYPAARRQRAIPLLDEWIAWTRRCRLTSFVKLAWRITVQRAGIVAASKHGPCPTPVSKRSSPRSE